MALASSGAALAHLTPRPNKTLFGSNYLSIAGNDFNFTKQFLPEVYEKEVERYGNRTISGFLSMVGAEMPMASDEVVWSEQGRIHVAYDDVVGTDVSANLLTFSAAHLLSIGDTIIASKGGATLKCYVSAVPSTTTITAQPYTVADISSIGSDGVSAVKVFVYGSEYAKGSSGAGNKKDATFTSFSNKPIILRDKYSVNGSDTAQIGWVEVATEAGTSGYLWYLKSEHEARIRFEDQLEMAMIEAEKVAAASAISATGISGSEGLFAAISSRGLVYNNADFDDGVSGGIHVGLAEFDAILQELDKQGSIEENMLFLDRATSLSIDNMLAAQNSYGAGGSSFGVFNNSEEMALNLGFSGFRRGSYDFYKSDMRYLNDKATRGAINTAAGSAAIRGIIVPAGTSTVYDQQLGKNLKRPFLHVRYRASQTDDRKMKSWVTGSVGAATSALDAMQIHMLSERCLVTQGANNFMLMK